MRIPNVPNKEKLRILNRPNQERLLTSIPERSPFGARDKAMLTLAIATGLRVAELVGLLVTHVCGFKPGGQGRRVREMLALPPTIGKGGRGRDIPLSPTARQAVLEILLFNRQRGFSVEPDAPLFPNRKHQAMSTRAVRRMLDNHCERADLDQVVTPHDLRHTCATRTIEKGAATHHVQQMLGHVRLSSSEVYLHAGIEQLAEIMARPD